MKYVIQIVESVGVQIPLPAEQWVGSYIRSVDFEANGGRGDVRITWDPEEALQFDSAFRAMEFWRTQSKTVPLRPTDGLPNRPLTAYTVSIGILEPRKEPTDGG